MSELARYHRQVLLPGFGEPGQRRLAGSTVLLVGCGALGTVIADLLCRAGVGRLRIVDRDLVELTNLQRQTLFDESDADAQLPKAVAAQRRLARVNSSVAIEPVVADFCAANALRLAQGAGVIVDGTDNFETRYLLNDLSVSQGVPYVYGGAVGYAGMVYVVLPHSPRGDAPWEAVAAAGPCLRCIFDEPPAVGRADTCDTAGVLGPLAAMIGAVEAAEALKILTGQWSFVSRTLLTVDAQRNLHRQLDVSRAHEPDRCTCCGERRFDYLDGRQGSRTVRLCGRNAVQIAASSLSDGAHLLDLEPIAARLSVYGRVQRNDFLLRADLKERGRNYQLTLFPDGRAILHGTDDPAIARGLYARYIGL